MIWNSKILFLHVPKTAGMSMTDLLLGNLAGPVFITDPSETRRDGRVNYINGKRHENLFDAESFFTYRNQSIEGFEKIFAVMRNPYALEVSRYNYLRLGRESDNGIAQKIALDSSFPEYMKKAPFFGQNPPRLDKYFHLMGRIPDNMVILRYESLKSDIAFHLSPYLESTELGHINQSKRVPLEEIYDPDTEEACYMRHRWFFDKGFYSRTRFKKPAV